MFREKFNNYLRAGFPCILVQTLEEIRTLQQIRWVAESRERKVFVFSITRGVVELTTGNNNKPDLTDPMEFVRFICEQKERSCIGVILDLGKLVEEDPFFQRVIKDAIVEFRRGKPLVFLTDHLKVPGGLSPFVVTIDVPLPDRAELEKTIREVAEESYLGDQDVIDSAVTALAGLTSDEAADAVALSIVSNNGVDPKAIMQSKCEQLSKLEFLKVIDHATLPSAEEVGGLDNLKEYLVQRNKVFSRKARENNIPIPRGLLLIGVPGCGKSLTVKAAGDILQLPVVQFRMSAIMDQWLGGSERNMRVAISVAEAMSPCVLWIDELDKQLGGDSSGSGGGQGGHEVTKRIIGELLTWLEEKKKPVYVMATANNIKAFSENYPELLRKGRWDDIFFVDLPIHDERKCIYEIHMKNYGRDPRIIDSEGAASASTNFSGAECEAVVREAITLAFDEDNEVDNSYIISTIKATIPQYEMSKDNIQSLRDWAQSRARPASRIGKLPGDKRRSIEK